ncbi:hypothetical protein [Lactovum odontotermitis]
MLDFSRYEIRHYTIWGKERLDVDFLGKKEELVGVVIHNFNGQVEGALRVVNKVLQEGGTGNVGYNDTYFEIHKDISIAHDDLTDPDKLNEDGNPEIDEVEIPTVTLKKILEDYIAKKKELRIE